MTEPDVEAAVAKALAAKLHWLDDPERADELARAAITAYETSLAEQRGEERELTDGPERSAPVSNGGDGVLPFNKGVGDSVRRWTLRVCPTCGGVKVASENFATCEGPHMGPFPTERSHAAVQTEIVEVVEAEWVVLWARDAALRSAEHWRREYDELYTSTREKRCR